MLKLLVPRFRPDLSARLKDIAEKQVPAKLKPIVDACWRDKNNETIREAISLFVLWLFPVTYSWPLMTFHDTHRWRHHLCRHIIGHHWCPDTPQLVTSPENAVVSLWKLEIAFIGPWNGLENEVMSRDPNVSDTWKVHDTLKRFK